MAIAFRASPFSPRLGREFHQRDGIPVMLLSLVKIKANYHKLTLDTYRVSQLLRCASAIAFLVYCSKDTAKH